MSDTWYFFHQAEAKSSWTLALASERDRINRDIRPELNTILDVNCSFDGDISQEEKDKVKYRGPMYFDFDSEDLEEVIPQFQQLLTNLKAKGVNLNALRIYASGGKGFHIEMPQQMLMAKLPPHGIAGLPLIYREVAHELYVNTLDLRVYSQGKGRQWRCPNIKRANGKYKVQISVDEAFAMTPEMYEDLTKYTRPVFPVEDAAFSPDIALIYSQARDKVEKALRNRGKRKKTADELKRFKGEWPETVRNILQGHTLKERVGWNYLCIQLAITATALGKTEDQLLNDAEGLIQSYQGDSRRYATVSQRKAELRNQYRYHQENPCYEFSVGGVLSLVQPALIDGCDLTQGEYKPESRAEEEASDEVDDEETEEETTRVRVNSNGMFARTENGWKNISHLGFFSPILLLLPNRELVGYDVEVFVSGKSQGRQLLNISTLSTKANLNAYANKFNASFRGTDMDAAHLLDTMRNRVVSKSRVSLVTQVEGVDLILPPDAESPDDARIVWSSAEGVICHGDHNFTYRPKNSGGPTFKSDLMKSDDLSDCDEDRQMISDMLSINAPHNLAKILGWYGATFLCPLLRKYFKQFPLLMVFGGASAGKSKTIALLSHMYYYMSDPKIVQASGITKWPLLVAVSSSNSIPLVVEELRPRLMRQSGMFDMFMNTLKSNYDGHNQERGTVIDGSKSGPMVNDYPNTAPIVFTAEEQNSEVAVQERSVQVAMSQADRRGRGEPFMRLEANAPRLARLGKAMVKSVLALDIPAFRSEFSALRAGIKEGLGEKADGKDRPIHNLATTLMGLRLMKMTLNQVFGEEFDERFDLMASYVMDHLTEFVPTNMSESSRILDTMAQLTKSRDMSVKLEKNLDYHVDEAAQTVDIKLKPAYAKYMRYQRSLGLQPMLETDTAFIAAMNRYEGVVAKACPDSPLFTNPFEAIFRFSIAFLEKDGVEPFKS